MMTTTRSAAVAVMMAFLVIPLPLRAVEVERREAGNLVIEGIPEIPVELQSRMLQYQNTRSAYLYGWDPTGSIGAIFVVSNTVTRGMPT